MKLLVAGVALLALGGCAIAPSKPDLALQARARATIPVCTTKKQCEGEWAAARDWVLNNCPMKIQTMTESYIQTYNGVGTDDADISCAVSKTPRPDGTYTISLAAGCGNMFGCVPNPWQALVDFNDAINAAGKTFASGPVAVAAGVR